MKLVSVSRAHVAVAAALLVTLACPLAAARSGDDRAAAGEPAAPAGAARPLTVWVETRGAGFDDASLRASLEHELARSVVLTREPGAAAVLIRFEGAARAQVLYTTPSGEQLSRSVELPPDRERSVQVVSWLTVNLVRDEASELLEQLRARRKQEAEARAAEEQAAADKAAADKAAADKLAAEKAAAEAARKHAAQAKSAENAGAGPSKKDGNAGLLRDPWRSFDLALATPISIIRDSPKRVMKLQLALWYGESGGMEGVSTSTVALRVRRDLLGVATAPGVAIIGGNARGVVMSVGYAQIDGVLDGVSIGAGATWQRGPFARGALLAVGGAFASRLTGAVAAGGIASAKWLNGVALAGGVTVIRGPSKGLLLAGGVNFSSDHRGLELAGGVNTARDLEGVAVAPINVHRRVNGLQVGVINIAEEVDGAAIGVISLAKNGRLQPVLWSSIDGSVHLAIKSIAGYAFTQIGAGIALDAASFSYDGGIGLHLRLFKDVFLEPGVHYSASNGTADASGAPDEQRLHYLAQLGYRAGNKLDLLAAAGLRHTLVGGAGAALAPELRAGIAFF